MKVFDNKGRRICPYIHPCDRHGVDKYGGKWKAKGFPVEIDSTYCRRCYSYRGVREYGVNRGHKQIICELELRDLKT
ncbi:MAG: hypothetical protein LBI03_11225 [Clostridiales bacterium]|jgi:hypothetical protein|nr:hypothetical protein [Clostridiales bacterium]